MKMNVDQVIANIIDTHQSPILYKTIKRGNVTKRRVWKIYIQETDKGVWSVISEAGDEGGKMVKTVVALVDKGVNIGKANETTPMQQALAIAISKFKDKLRTYTLDSLTPNVLYPMKAMDLSKANTKKYLVYPAFAQRKLDGVRCMATMQNGKVVMFSMKREPIVAFPHVLEELEVIFKEVAAKYGEQIASQFHLDGELYNHHLSLQKISGYSRRKVAPVNDPVAESIQYCVFDCFVLNQLDMPFYQRFVLVKPFLVTDDFKQRYKHVHMVKTYYVNNNEEMGQMLQKFVSEGYEGIILRNTNGPYTPSKLSSNRSKDLFKYKISSLEDYEIVDIVRTPGPSFGILIVVRIPETGKTFELTGNGTEEYRRQVLKEKKNFIGHRIRFAYYGRTSDYVPKFASPVLKKGEYVISD